MKNRILSSDIIRVILGVLLLLVNTTNAHAWAQTGTAVLSHLKVNAAGQIESDVGLATASSTYVWTDGSRPRTVGADYRVYNDTGVAVSQTNAGSTAFSFGSGIEVRLSKLTSHGGTDLQIYAPTGQDLRLMSPAGAGTKFYIGATGNIVATPTNSLNVSTGNLVVSSGNIQGDNILNAAGTGPFEATLGMDVAAGEDLTVGDGAKLMFAGSTNGWYFDVASSRMIGWVGGVLDIDSYWDINNTSFRGSEIAADVHLNQARNGAFNAFYGMDVPAGEAVNVDNIYDSTGITRPTFPVGLNVDDQIRMVDGSGIAIKTSGGTNVFVLGTDRSYFYKPAVFSETAPVSNITNMVQLYAADNVGVNTLYGRNDAGTDKIIAP